MASEEGATMGKTRTKKASAKTDRWGEPTMRRRSLTFRVGLAACASTLVVIAGFAMLLHREMQSALEGWERAHMAGLGHHLAEMLAPLPQGQREAELEEIATLLAGFGISARLGAVEGSVPSGVQVPLAPGSPPLEVWVAPEAGESLARRLAKLYLALTGGVLLALLVAIVASIYWGLMRPLRGLRKQVAQMHRGRWRAPAHPEGVAEIAEIAKGLESLGGMLELRIYQWVQAERRAGVELARKRLRIATRDLRVEVQLLIGELLAREDLSAVSRRHLRRLQRDVEALGTQLDRPLEELGLGLEAPGRYASEL
jgi:hypothetical protein